MRRVHPAPFELFSRAARRYAAIVWRLGVFVLLALTPAARSSQVPIDSFVRLDADDRLINADIRVIAQDPDGFIWLGTRIRGLLRYDGYEVRSYDLNGGHGRAPGPQIILSLLIDREGTLWAGTESGLARIDRRTGAVTLFRRDPKQPDSLPNDTVVSIYEAKDGTLWLGTRGGLCRVDDRLAGKFTNFQRPPVIEGSGNKDTIRSVIEDPKTGLLWLGASDGLAAFDRHTSAFATFINDPADPSSIVSNSVNKVVIGPDGVFWALTETGLSTFVPTLRDVPQHSVQQPRITFRNQVQPYDPDIPGRNYIRDGIVDRRSRIWLATRGGLVVVDPATGAFYDYRRRHGDPTSLSDDLVHTVFEDRAGNIWVGTFAGGVCRLRSETKPFRVDRYLPTEPRSLSDDRISGLALDPVGRLWASTSNGLCRLDRDGWTRFLNSPDDPDSIPSNDLSAVAVTPKGELWMATQFSGVIRFDGQHFAKLPSTNMPAGAGSYPFTGTRIEALLADSRGGVWVGARGYGLDYFSGNSFHHYPPAAGYPTFNAIPCLETEGGLVWFATERSGLVRFDPATEAFSSFLPSTVTQDRSSNNLQCVSRGQDGLLWVGGAGGLLSFDPHTRTFLRHYTSADGLPNNVVVSVVPDRRGHVWIGTAGGLSDFTPRTGSFRNYDMNDGLPSNVFSPWSAVAGTDGRLYFGTRGGILSFVPESIRDDLAPPPVVITELRWLGEDRSTHFGTHPNWPYGSTLNVAPRQLGFSLKFAALDFAAPDKSVYRYQLQGWDSSWVSASARERTATYTALPPGRYIFRVQAANADGIWNERGVSLPIIIAPNLWETEWFRVGALIAAVAAMGAGLHWQLGSIRRRNALLEELVAQRTAELKEEIAGREQVAAALREAKAQLEARVAVRTAELASTNRSLESEIAERRMIEAQLQQSQKMEAIGQLAGGIAHDFNNLLTVIIGQSELLGMDELPKERQFEAVRDIKAAANRAAKLTRQLLVFSRREPAHLAVIDANVVVGSAIELLGRLIGANIKLETSLAPPPVPVCADGSMLEQVLLNFSLNARDAMPDGGKIVLTTSTATLAQPDPGRSPNALAGHYACIEVRDDGCGIPPESLPMIFEPFFTTKARGKGTGLGLAISFRVIQQHRGWIEVESTVGKGSVFRVWLPLHPGAVSPPEAVAVRPPSKAIHTGTVLVVEDENEVRLLATHVLERSGFRVIPANSGAVALELWAIHQHEITFLLTDLVMPGSPNGRDLARELREQKPDLMVVTMSGYDPTPTEQLANVVHLRKPFTVPELIEAVAGTATRA